MNPALLLLAALLLSLSIFAQPSSSEPFWTQDNAAVSLAAIDAIEPFDDPEDDADLLETVALYPNSPNPFNPETEIAFDLPSTSLVTVCVYDIVGQHVS